VFGRPPRLRGERCLGQYPHHVMPRRLRAQHGRFFMDGEHCRDAIQRKRLSPLMPSRLAVRGGEQSAWAGLCRPKDCADVHTDRLAGQGWDARGRHNPRVPLRASGHVISTRRAELGGSARPIRPTNTYPMHAWASCVRERGSPRAWCRRLAADLCGDRARASNEALFEPYRSTEMCAALHSGSCAGRD
jgi:hypothetical protein